MTAPHFILKHVNQWHEIHFFVANGPVHKSAALGTIHLISAVTPDIVKARRFDTAPEAAQVLVNAGNPTDWSIETI